MVLITPLTGHSKELHFHEVDYIKNGQNHGSGLSHPDLCVQTESKASFSGGEIAYSANREMISPEGNRD